MFISEFIFFWGWCKNGIYQNCGNFNDFVMFCEIILIKVVFVFFNNCKVFFRLFVDFNLMKVKLLGLYQGCN